MPCRKGGALALNSGFVSTDGTIFSLNGRPFCLVGANNYYLGFAPDSMVKPVFDLAFQMGLNVLRTWAFLDCGIAEPNSTPANAKDGVFFHYWNTAAGRPDFNDGPNGLERLDRTVALAEQYDIRLILPLVNYWDDFGGVKQYVEWFGLSGRYQFYKSPDARQAYQRYLEHLLLRVNTRTGRRYRDEPAILAWELANEPRCVDDDGNSLRHGTDTLLDWVQEMSGYIKSLDPNHLVAVGDEGYFRRRFSFGRALYNGSFGVDCERLLGIATVDLGTCHLYPNFAGSKDSVGFGGRWIREHLEVGRRAGKPMIIEEYGWKSGGSDAAAENASRNSAFRTWLDQIVRSDGAGALVWMIASVDADGQRYPDYDRYTIYSARDAPSILEHTRIVAAANRKADVQA